MEPVELIRFSSSKSTCSIECSSADELDAAVAKRMAAMRVFNKRVTFTEEELDVLIEKWTDIARRFGIEKFDQALQRCVDEIPGWPDVPEILQRIPRPEFVGDFTKEYRAKLAATRRDAEAWENSQDYHEWHARVVEPLDAKLRARASEELALRPASSIPVLDTETERAYIAERVKAFEAANPELAAQLKARFQGREQ